MLEIDGMSPSLFKQKAKTGIKTMFPALTILLVLSKSLSLFLSWFKSLFVFNPAVKSLFHPALSILGLF